MLLLPSADFSDTAESLRLWPDAEAGTVPEPERCSSGAAMATVLAASGARPPVLGAAAAPAPVARMDPELLPALPLLPGLGLLCRLCKLASAARLMLSPEPVRLCAWFVPRGVVEPGEEAGLLLVLIALLLGLPPAGRLAQEVRLVKVQDELS